MAFCLRQNRYCVQSALLGPSPELTGYSVKELSGLLVEGGKKKEVITRETFGEGIIHSPRFPRLPQYLSDVLTGKYLLAHQILPYSASGEWQKEPPVNLDPPVTARSQQASMILTRATSFKCPQRSRGWRPSIRWRSHGSPTGRAEPAPLKLAYEPRYRSTNCSCHRTTMYHKSATPKKPRLLPTTIHALYPEGHIRRMPNGAPSVISRTKSEELPEPIRDLSWISWSDIQPTRDTQLPREAQQDASWGRCDGTLLRNLEFMECLCPWYPQVASSSGPRLRNRKEKTYAHT